VSRLTGGFVYLLLKFGFEKVKKGLISDGGGALLTDVPSVEG
jgi:hypothetical protein